MNTWCYTREPGAEGNIVTAEGDGPGTTVEALIERERPPLKAAFEIGSAVADLLCISLEDGQVHGDIRSSSIRVDDRGAVSVDGWGVLRTTTRAPEGRADRAEADVYGLGLLLHAVLSPSPLGTLPRDPDAHDEAVVNRAVSLNLGAVAGKRWVDELRNFLCACLAWNANERPAPLDVANVLALAAAQTPGEGLASWARRASSNSPRRAPVAAPPPVRDDGEHLGGPVSLSAPIKKGGMRQAPSSKGASTAAWTKEKLAAMYADEDQEFLAEMEARQSPPAENRRVAAPAAPPARPATPVASPPPRIEPRPSRAAEVETVEVRTPVAIASSTPVEDEPPKKSNTGLIIGGIIALIVLCGGGVTLLGGAGYLYTMMGGTPSTGTEETSETSEKTEEKAEEKSDAEKADAEKTDAEKTDAAKTDAAKTDATDAAKTDEKTDVKADEKTEAAPTTTSSSTTPKATSSSSSSSSSSSTSKSTTPTTTTKTTTPTTSTTTPPKSTKTTTTPAAEPSFTSYQVRFSANGGEAKVQCGDGQTAEFAGTTTLTFIGTQTCRVRIGRGQGAVQVSKGGTVTCSDDNGRVTCTGP